MACLATDCSRLPIVQMVFFYIQISEITLYLYINDSKRINFRCSLEVLFPLCGKNVGWMQLYDNYSSIICKNTCWVLIVASMYMYSVLEMYSFIPNFSFTVIIYSKIYYYSSEDSNIQVELLPPLYSLSFLLAYLF